MIHSTRTLYELRFIKGGMVATASTAEYADHASKNKAGFYIDSAGIGLPVSASDLERWMYCPLSWKLSKEGVSAAGEAVQEGVEKHREIHRKMEKYHSEDIKVRREMVIWSWWFAVVITLSADTAAFFFVSSDTIDEFFVQQVGKFLVLLALVWLVTSILLILLPWRRWLGWPFGLAQPPATLTEFDAQDVAPIPSPWKLGESDWLTFGRMEAVLLLGATSISLHGVALSRAVNRDGATFALLVLALIWTLFTAARLQRALQLDSKREKARVIAGLELGDQVEYSDDDGHAKLLFDDETGLRGRPDQIVRMQGQFIPVEVKTGKVPPNPHGSHRMQLLAYLHLVEQIVDEVPPFGILRYGEETAFSIAWNEVSRAELMTSVKEVQRLMVEGGAARNHEREGKCRNCSRRAGCSESLV